MNKYIVSLVFGKTMGVGELSIQNEVYVLQEMGPDAAYEKCKRLGMLKWPDHRIVTKVIVEMNEAEAQNVN